MRKEGDGQSVSGDNGFNLCQILRALKLKYVMLNSSFFSYHSLIHLL